MWEALRFCDVCIIAARRRGEVASQATFAKASGSQQRLVVLEEQFVDGEEVVAPAFDEIAHDNIGLPAV